MTRFAIALTMLVSAACPSLATSETRSATAGSTDILISRVADGLDEPWGLAFLPDGRFLVTERKGGITLFPSNGGQPLARFDGIPGVVSEGQGGMLDVLVPSDFERNREILFTYSKVQPDGAGTALGVGRLSETGTALEDVRVLFEMAPGSSGGRHFGSRIVEARDGTIFLSIGDRGAAARAQDTRRHEGSVIHLKRDGSPASPGLFGGDALGDLYSKGHRNPQGAALDSQGNLWVVEHGAMGGDELNLIAPGRNYGWPLVSFGKNYDGTRIGEGTEAPGLEQPVHYWDPSIAPSGLMIYSGAMFPEWTGDVFTGSLKFDYIAHLDPDDGYSESRIEGPETGRVRDIREAADGSIWFISADDGAIYRIAKP